MKARSAFTIVELLVVVAIIGVLLGIVGTAATSSIKASRERRADAMRTALQQAIASYHAQDGNSRWPDAIESKASSANDTVVTLTASEADSVFRQIVQRSVGTKATSPLVDASALFVVRTSNLKGNNGKGCNDKHENKSESGYCGDQKCVAGMDFLEAVKRNVPVSEMSFGWQGKEYGMFRRFWITYNTKTDSVTVSKTK